MAYLNVGTTEFGDTIDFRTGDSRRFELQHLLQARLQLRNGGRHCEDFLATEIATEADSRTTAIMIRPKAPKDLLLSRYLVLQLSLREGQR